MALKPDGSRLPPVALIVLYLRVRLVRTPGRFVRLYLTAFTYMFELEIGRRRELAMKKHRVTASMLALGLLFMCTLPSSAEYVRAKPNDAAQAEAYFNMVARGSRRGFFAMGNPNFVGGYALGAGIGNMIRQARTKQDCMTMLGYEWAKPKSAAKNKSRTGANSSRIESGSNGSASEVP